MDREYSRGSRPADSVIALIPQVTDIAGDVGCAEIDDALAKLEGLRHLHPQLDGAYQLLQSAANPDLSKERVCQVATAALESSRRQVQLAKRIPMLWSREQQANFEAIAETPPGTMSAALKDEVKFTLLDEAKTTLKKLVKSLEFWAQYKPFARVAATVVPAHATAVVDQIACTKDAELALLLRNDLFGRVLEAIAEGRCGDPAQLAKAALQVEDLEFPRQCNHDRDDD